MLPVSHFRASNKIKSVGRGVVQATRGEDLNQTECDVSGFRFDEFDGHFLEIHVVSFWHIDGSLTDSLSQQGGARPLPNLGARLPVQGEGCGSLRSTPGEESLRTARCRRWGDVETCEFRSAPS